MNSHASLICILVALLATFAAQGAATRFEPQPLEGQTFIHDPSTIVKDGGGFYVFGTKPGISVRSSADLIHWTNEPPAWTKNVAPGFDGYFGHRTSSG